MGSKRKARSWLIIIAVMSAIGVMSLATGCSTLGIATVEEMEALDSRVQTQNRSTTSRLDTIEQQNTQVLQQLSSISARLDTLETDFERAADWLRALDLDEISTAAKDASELSAQMQAQTQSFLMNYMRWIKTQRDALDAQLQDLEAKLEKKTDDEAPVEPPPADDSGDDGGGR